MAMRWASGLGLVADSLVGGHRVQNARLRPSQAKLLNRNVIEPQRVLRRAGALDGQQGVQGSLMGGKPVGDPGGKRLGGGGAALFPDVDCLGVTAAADSVVIRGEILQSSRLPQLGAAVCGARRCENLHRNLLHLAPIPFKMRQLRVMHRNCIQSACSSVRAGRGSAACGWARCASPCRAPRRLSCWSGPTAALADVALHRIPPGRAGQAGWRMPKVCKEFLERAPGCDRHRHLPPQAQRRQLHRIAERGA